MLPKNQEQQGISTMAKFETDENVRERNLNHTDAEHDSISDDSVKIETNSKFNINIINSEVVLHTSLTSQSKGKTEPENQSNHSLHQPISDLKTSIKLIISSSCRKRMATWNPRRTLPTIPNFLMFQG
jgi:hypothetical protein